MYPLRLVFGAACSLHALWGVQRCVLNGKRCYRCSNPSQQIRRQRDRRILESSYEFVPFFGPENADTDNSWLGTSIKRATETPQTKSPCSHLQHSHKEFGHINTFILITIQVSLKRERNSRKRRSIWLQPMRCSSAEEGVRRLLCLSTENVGCTTLDLFLLVLWGVASIIRAF